MQWLLRIVCIGYVIFLTMLLLTADPSRLIGVEGDLPWELQDVLPTAHAISFLVLAVLALAPRWPVPRWGIVIILAIYGGMTEVLQALVPPRTPEWMDWFQDLGGIAAGTVLYWLPSRHYSTGLPKRDAVATADAARVRTIGKSCKRECSIRPRAKNRSEIDRLF